MMSDSYPKSFFENLESIQKTLATKEIYLFLDYDGTLTPIVATPDLAVLSDDMRQTVQRLSKFFKISVVSGRATDDVKSKVRLPGLFYAGSHGFEIVDPQGNVTLHPDAQTIRKVIDEVHAILSGRLEPVRGALVENVKFTISVHYRLVAQQDFPVVQREVERILEEHPGLRKTEGKKVFELRPNIPWDKGKAVNGILDALNFDVSQHVAIYIGDDTTDEDAFRVIQDKGFGILVAETPKPSGAKFFVKDTPAVRQVLDFFIQTQQGQNSQ